MDNTLLFSFGVVTDVQYAGEQVIHKYAIKI